MAKNQTNTMRKGVKNRLSGDSAQEASKSLRTKMLVLWVGLSVFISALLVPSKGSKLPDYQFGDIAKKTIKSDADYAIVDEERTQFLYDQAVSNVAPVYEYRTQTLQEANDNLDALQGILNALKQDTSRDTKSLLASIQKESNFDLGASQLNALRKIDQLELYFQSLKNFLRVISEDQFIVKEKHALVWNTTTGIELSAPENTDVRSRAITNRDDLVDVAELSNRIEKDLPDYLKSQKNLNLNSDLISAGITIVSASLEPNLMYSEALTEKSKQIAAKEVKPAEISLRKGETIIRDGDRVLNRHLTLLAGIKKQSQNQVTTSSFIGLLLLSLLVLGTLTGSALLYLTGFDPEPKHYYLMASLLVTLLIISEGLNLLFARMGTVAPDIPFEAWRFMIPVAFGAMVVRVVLRTEAVLYFAIVSSIFLAGIFQFDFNYGIYCLLSGLAGAFLISKSQSRVALFRSSVYLGLLNVMLMLILTIPAGQTWPLVSIAWASISVFFFSTVALFVCLSIAFPLVEYFDFLTDFKLLELANFNHPLLHRLAIEAPGTYHHSRVVAQLVEAAAPEVGANPLLAMVSALYHDIGKTKAPQYFAENQDASLKNAHDKLKPSMSKMIIVSHIKDGIEMAKRAGLPSEIINAIPEHHGTSLIAFFYNKAKELEDPELDQIDENEYRYPGPKPRTKETALLLLADSVEATTKSLSDPTPEKIQGVIQKMFNIRFSDGQLEECDLTLKDLNKIAKSFHRTLTSVYKPRIEYPNQTQNGNKSQKVKKQDASRNSQSSKSAQSKSSEGEQGDGEDLKRLGL